MNNTYYTDREKPIYSVGDKLKITQEFLDRTKWSDNNNYDYIQIDAFRQGEYHYDTPIIDGEYAREYSVSGHRINPHYTTGRSCYRFWVQDINTLPKF